MGSVTFSILLSFKIALISTFFVLIFGTYAGYILAFKQFRGKNLLDVLFTLPMVLPPTVTGYYLVVIFGRNGILGSTIYDLTGWTMLFTWQGAVVASFIVSLPLMIRTSRAAMESIDQNLINGATLLGYSKMEIFFKVIMPISKKGIIAGTILAFARGLGEFGATLMVAGNIPGRTDTVPIAIYGRASSGDWAGANRLVLMFTFISALFLYFALFFGRKKR